MIIDNLCMGRLENIAHHRNREDFHFIQGDVRNLDSIKDILKDVDAIFHEAALVSVTRSVENHILTNEVNLTGTLTLLKACLDSDVRRFIHASSSSVYGDTETLPKHEDLPFSRFPPMQFLSLPRRSMSRFSMTCTVSKPFVYDTSMYTVLDRHMVHIAGHNHFHKSTVKRPSAYNLWGWAAN